VALAAGIFLLRSASHRLSVPDTSAPDGGTFDEAECRESVSGRCSGVVTLSPEAVFENPFGIV